MIDLPDDLPPRLRAARRVVALTGAGISAESGVPTFRDAQTGLWARFDPAELATPEAFADDPQRVWQWYDWRGRVGGGAAAWWRRPSPTPGIAPSPSGPGSPA